MTYQVGSFLVGGFLVAVWCVYFYVSHIAPSDKAIRDLEALNGSGTSPYSLDAGPRSIFLSTPGLPPKVTDTSLKQIIRDLVHLKPENASFEHTSITDLSMPNIVSLNTLQYINLTDVNVSPDGLMILRRLPHLKYICVSKGLREALSAEQTKEFVDAGINVFSE